MNWKIAIAEIAPALLRYFCASFETQMADDLVQETIVRLFQKVEAQKFDPKLGNLRMYAFGIAHFVRLEALRRPERHIRCVSDLDTASPLPLPDERFDQNQSVARLRQAIRTLSEIQQQVLALYLDHELSHDEIGLILSIPKSTVKSHLHRAKDKLKVALLIPQEKPK
jgi:RNA polymerase sigma factor (sigma-70 family)